MSRFILSWHCSTLSFGLPPFSPYAHQLTWVFMLYVSLVHGSVVFSWLTFWGKPLFPLDSGYHLRTPFLILTHAPAIFIFHLSSLSSNTSHNNSRKIENNTMLTLCNVSSLTNPVNRGEVEETDLSFISYKSNSWHKQLPGKFFLSDMALKHQYRYSW